MKKLFFLIFIYIPTSFAQSKTSNQQVAINKSLDEMQKLFQDFKNKRISLNQDLNNLEGREWNNKSEDYVFYEAPKINTLVLVEKESYFDKPRKFGYYFLNTEGHGRSRDANFKYGCIYTGKCYPDAIRVLSPYNSPENKKKEIIIHGFTYPIGGITDYKIKLIFIQNEKNLDTEEKINDDSEAKIYLQTIIRLTSKRNELQNTDNKIKEALKKLSVDIDVFKAELLTSKPNTELLNRINNVLYSYKNIAEFTPVTVSASDILNEINKR